MEKNEGHEHLSSLYNQVLSHLSISTDTAFRVNNYGEILLGNISREDVASFNNYYRELTVSDGYLSERYDWYRKEVDSQLWEPLGERTKGHLMWTLSSYAVAGAFRESNLSPLLPNSLSAQDVNTVCRLGQREGFSQTQLDLWALSNHGVIGFEEPVEVKSWTKRIVLGALGVKTTDPSKGRKTL